MLFAGWLNGLKPQRDHQINKLLMNDPKIKSDHLNTKQKKNIVIYFSSHQFWSMINENWSMVYWLRSECVWNALFFLKKKKNFWTKCSCESIIIFQLRKWGIEKRFSMFKIDEFILVLNWCLNKTFFLFCF